MHPGNEGATGPVRFWQAPGDMSELSDRSRVYADAGSGPVKEPAEQVVKEFPLGLALRRSHDRFLCHLMLSS